MATALGLLHLSTKLGGNKIVKQSIRGMQLTLGLAALWFVPAVAHAQVTVTSVKVTVSGPGSTAIYCSTSLHCAANPNDGNIEVWDLGASGVTLAGGETLVLAQTALITALPGGNFDTSDRVRQPAQFATGPFELACTAATPCAVAVEINGTLVYTNAAGGVLAAFNNDHSAPEGTQWAQVYAQANYSLSLGYADNEHGVSFFPTPFATGATRFIGAGTTPPAPLTTLGTCSTNCYDSGALMITGIRTTPTCTVTQGGWGSTPRGNNPGAFLAANFPAAGETIGGSPFFLTFTTAASVKNFLPQGGPPGALTSSATNPTAGTSAGVFAGQVLALQLNVDLKGFGSLVLSGTGTSLDGKTVTQVLAAANLALAGGALPAGFTYSSLNDLVDLLNNSFDGCVATAWATAHLH
jgi:hypothetical protein